LDTLWSGGPFNATDDNPYNGGNPTSPMDPQILKDVRTSIFDRGNASESSPEKTQLNNRCHCITRKFSKLRIISESFSFLQPMLIE
jgi:hypothetical protein